MGHRKKIPKGAGLRQWILPKFLKEADVFFLAISFLTSSDIEGQVV